MPLSGRVNCLTAGVNLNQQALGQNVGSDDAGAVADKERFSLTAGEDKAVASVLFTKL